jgi:hypothetical protein
MSPREYFFVFIGVLNSAFMSIPGLLPIDGYT